MHLEYKMSCPVHSTSYFGHAYNTQHETLALHEDCTCHNVLKRGLGKIKRYRLNNKRKRANALHKAAGEAELKAEHATDKARELNSIAPDKETVHALRTDAAKKQREADDKVRIASEAAAKSNAATVRAQEAQQATARAKSLEKKADRLKVKAKVAEAHKPTDKQIADAGKQADGV